MPDGRASSWTPERRAAQAERMRKRMADPQAKKKQRERSSKIMTTLHADGFFRTRHYRRLFALNERIDVKRANADRCRERWQNPAERAALQAKMKAGWDDDRRAAQAEAVAKRNRRRINRLGVPEGYEDLYRLFRSKHYSRDEAIAAVLATARGPTARMTVHQTAGETVS
jgi:hypothetical protein